MCVPVAWGSQYPLVLEFSGCYDCWESNLGSLEVKSVLLTIETCPWTLELLVSAFQVVGVISRYFHAWFMWYWQLNPGLCACYACPLPTQLHPKPCTAPYFLLREEKNIRMWEKGIDRISGVYSIGTFFPLSSPQVFIFYFIYLISGTGYHYKIRS